MQMFRLTVATVMLFAASAHGEEPEALDPAQQLALIEAVSPNLVRVEYTLRFDKGEEPSGAEVSYTCPNCGRPHYTRGGEQFIREERPFETPGFLIGPTTIIAPDVPIHDRFVESINVRYGEQLVAAKRAGYARRQNAVYLELAGPLADAKVLTFAADADEPYLTVTYTQGNGTWTTAVQPLAASVSVSPGGRQFIAVPAHCLIVDTSGQMVGMSMTGELPTDDSWKVSALQWPRLADDERTARLEQLEQLTDRNLLRVTLNFRSPKKGGPQHDFNPMGSDDATATEMHTVGVLIGEQRVLVLGQLDAKTTARLERIRVFAPDGNEHQATFVATLADYGALVGQLTEPMAGPVGLAGGDILDYRNQLLLTAEIRVAGEQRIPYFGHGRISSYEIGWKRNVYPGASGRAEDKFLFDLDGQLVALPISRRAKVATKERWDTDSPQLTAVQQLAGVLGNLDEHIEASIVPLSEEEENRVAWMGVVLQDLDRELARANNVSEQTQDGELGALVTFVYPDSPAAQAGIEPGAILLRIHAEGQPKPIDVNLDDDGYRFFESFPWDRLDEIPEQYFDQVPSPWPPAENAFTRKLTDLGFGTKYAAEFFIDGQIVNKDFVVTQSPRHFDSAPRHKSEILGMTVRDLTFEVRRHLLMKPDDPGVVISKIEPGEKAAIAGIKPYEIITHVDGQPVVDGDTFEKLIEGKTKLRLSVKRMTRGRQVQIKLDQPAAKPDADDAAAEPATQPKAPDAAPTP